MFIAQTLSETCFDDEAQLHRTQVIGTTENHTTQSPSSENGTMSWTGFYRMMDEVLPQDLKRNKANSDSAIALAVDRGFDGWRYDSKVSMSKDRLSQSMRRLHMFEI